MAEKCWLFGFKGYVKVYVTEDPLVSAVNKAIKALVKGSLTKDHHKLSVIICTSEILRKPAEVTKDPVKSVYGGEACYIYMWKAKVAYYLDLETSNEILLDCDPAIVEFSERSQINSKTMYSIVVDGSVVATKLNLNNICKHVPYALQLVGREEQILSMIGKGKRAEKKSKKAKGESSKQTTEDPEQAGTSKRAISVGASVKDALQKMVSSASDRYKKSK